MNLTSVDFDPFAAPSVLKGTTSTESQRELWTAAEIGADASAAFNEALSLRLQGPLDRPALEEAVAVLVASHEALHTSFSADGTTLLVEEPKITVTFADLTGLGDTERRIRIETEQRDQVTKPFVLTEAPLLRVRLLATNEREHLLLISAHHIVCDGWSMSVCLNDLAELYSQRASGKPLLPVPRPPFSDYAETERRQLATDEYKEAERYWLDRFQGEAPVVDLPNDHPRPPQKTYASDRVDHVLDAALVSQLKELGARRGASFFVTLLASFKTLIFRLTGAEDLVVGIPAAGQSFTDQPKLVGHCVNMLPLRSTLTPRTHFTELLSNVRRELLDSYEHQQLTFGALLRKLALPRDPSRLPLITLAFNVDQAITGDALSFSGLKVEVATTPRAFENFDLFVNAAEKHGAVTLETQYSTALFARSTVERWLRGFEVLLRSLVERPDAALSAVALVSAAEVAQLAAWNAASARPFDSDTTVAQLILEQCGRTPDRIALEASDGALSYAELDRRSREVAAELRARNLGPGDLVGISLERSSRLVVAALAVLRAGAGYVPLDPSFPRDRLTFMAEDAGLSLLLTERSLAQDLGAADVPRLFLDEPLPEPTLTATRAESVRASDPAYVIYTSGSTGKPKGVVVPNGAVVNFLRSMREEPGLGEADRLLAVTTLSFDISVLELFLPLSVGATVVLATAAEAMDGLALRTLFETQRINAMQATPATWRLLLAADERFRPGFRALCGGEALPKALADELLATGVELWNMYGPTETTVWSTCRRILPSDQRMLIGRPIANTQIHIVDTDLRPVPIGVTGELCITGRGVTLGYHERPELTAERFVQDPVGPGRLYRTGDLARFTNDGSIECLGRSDGQVKLRGYRIELGEIETLLARHADVRQTVVIVREDRVGDQRLVAYIVPKQQMPEADALREYLKRSVPDYMVPQHFFEMAALPLTPNGKVDKKKLPAPLASSASTAARYVPAETDSERLIQKIWQRPRGTERVGATDDFFQLGGHSLLAAQAMSQLTRETGVTLSMRRLFEAPTCRALAKILDEARTGSAQSESIPHRAPDALAPLSPMQQRLWFMEDMNPGTSVYNLPSCFRLRGQLDAPALNRALNAIAERHTTLRSTLDWIDGELCQSVQSNLVFDLTPTDLSQTGASEREEQLLRSLHAAAAVPFDLRKGPLVRASLFRLGTTENVLFFMPHHAVWDGWSFDVFLDELDRLYAAFSRGEPGPLAPLTTTYGDFAAWQKQWLTGRELEEQTRFWLEQLSGELPVLDLPTDNARPANMTFAGATEAFELDGRLVEQLGELGKRCGATLYMVLVAAFDVLLARVTGQNDIILGTPIRGRSRPELEPLLGYFVNALVLRTQVDASETFLQLLKRVRHVCIQAFGHQDMPFEVLVQKLKVERDLSRTPLYSAFFTFQDVRNRKSSIGELSYEQIHVHPPVSPTDLSLWVKQLDSKIVGGLDYATDLFRRDTARRWLAEFQELLRAIVADSERPVSRLQLLPPEERRALAAVSNTQRPYPRDAWLHQLIEAQVDRSPEAVAAICGSQRATYAELDTRANQLGWTLREAGIGSGSRVGICVERSLDLLVAALAVQKCGAAYVPLDPAFPADRLSFMAGDSGLAALIVHDRTQNDAPRAEGAKIIDLDAERALIAARPVHRLPTPEGSNSVAPAYVIYTSGSTGKPKGVMVPHQAVVNFITSMALEPGFKQNDRLLAVTTLSFDIAVLELYAPLSVGARVVIASREEAADGDLLDEAIDEHGITIMQATPTTWRLLLQAGFRPGADFKILCGGEAFPQDLAKRLLEVGGEVWNLYGPTETTVWSTCTQLTSPVSDIMIGRPIANTSVHVVDAQGELAPWGSPGELWIGGDGVTLGYHERPELTAERFVTNPFAPGRAYRTGDIVRLRGPGELEYLRRNDNQVKLRGYRIELGEIEATLSSQPGVKQCVVIVREDQPSDPRLVAYLVVSGDADSSDASLRKQLRGLLPQYMIPQHFVVLERIPLTPNGKVDRRALPSPLPGSGGHDESYVAPATEKERTLAKLWQELLGVQRVSARDNFFDLGGHSLLCLQMTAKIEQLTGQRLNPRLILRNDLSQISALLPELRAAPATQAPEPAQKSLAQRLLGRLTNR